MERRVVIVGAGVIGLCSAYYAAQRGYRVTVLDRLPRQRDGCSFGNAGMIVPSHFVPLAAPGMVALGLKWMWNPESPFYIKPRLSADLLGWGYRFWRAARRERVERAAPLLRDLSFASRECFEQLEAGFATGFDLTRRGLLMLCKEPRTLEEEAGFAARANQLGVPAEVLDAGQTAALEPGVTMDVAGAVYFPRDAHLTPHRFMAGLEAECGRAGVEFGWDTGVHGVVRDGPRLRAVRTSAGEIEADEFVLAGGAWSPGLAAELDLRLRMQAGKGYSLTLANPRQRPQRCAIFAEARVAATPMGDTLRFGGTMEIAGLSEEINPARVRGIVNAVPRYFPEFSASDFAGIRPWVGLRPCSPDGLPYLGRTAKYPNVIIATGHAMMGLSLGPVTGRIVAELLAGELPAWDLSLLDPDRHA